jgi:hypothetical protein
MTNEEILEIAQTAHAQASAAQGVLLALIRELRGNMISDEVLNRAFDLAAETYVRASYDVSNKLFAAHATRTLQAVDHMRQTLIRKD